MPTTNLYTESGPIIFRSRLLDQDSVALNMDTAGNSSTFRFKSPAGVITELVGSVVTGSGDLGWVESTTASGFFSGKNGGWIFDIKTVYQGGLYYTNPGCFTVHEIVL